MSTPRDTGTDSRASLRRLVLVNQFIPPAPPPTARLLSDLAQAAEASGWETVLFGRQRGYGGRPVTGWRRYLRDLSAHLRIGWGLLWVRRPACVVCLSDPPCLLVTVVLMARLRRVPVIHWAMDVYPETALALGQLQPGRLSRLLARAMTRAYGKCQRCVALDEDMAEHIGGAVRGKVPVDVLAPWPPAILPNPNPSQPSDSKPQEPADKVWLYSGNLGRAHDWQTVIAAQHQLERLSRQDPKAPVWRLVLQGGGGSMAEARRESERLGLRRVDFRPYAAETNLLPALLAADVLIATLKPELRGLLWPSKLALMMLCDKPIAWIGPTEGAIVRFLQNNDRTGIFAAGAAEPLVAWLDETAVTPAAGSSGAQHARVATRVDQIRTRGLAIWHGWLANT